MQRNWDLVRAILTSLEEKEATHDAILSDQISGYSPDVVAYHMNLLDEAGLIKAKCLRSFNEPMTCLALSLTWDGHEFLDSIRSDTMWNKIKSTIKTKGLELNFEVIKQAAVWVIGQAFTN